MKEIELAVFDLAGTIIESGGEVTEAFKTALQRYGINSSQEEIDERMGSSKLEVISSFVRRDLEREDPELEQEIYAKFNTILVERYANGGAVSIQGVEKALWDLKRRDVKIAFTTGFGAEVANTILDNLSWRNGLADAVVCSDEVPAGRPAPYMIFRAMERSGTLDVSRVLVAGDTVHDLEAGSNAGAAMIVGVLSGAHSVSQLGRSFHSHMLPSVSSLPEILG